MFGSVRFLVYSPTIFVFLLFASHFVSRVVSFFFDVGVMGVTSRCLASRDNLTKMFVRGYFVSVYCPVAVSIIVFMVCIVYMDYTFPASVTLHAVRDS